MVFGYLNDHDLQAKQVHCNIEPGPGTRIPSAWRAELGFSFPPHAEFFDFYYVREEKHITGVDRGYELPAQAGASRHSSPDRPGTEASLADW
ncbi:hypothetical protein DSL72_008010 [Monilinia vaccinii-corymbosi]|uniref:Uncharacterized protein n=1 Tax=Monilinia vaccinii-corymbosi TaxID=61207 RepID=A0A8A3PJF6_9HELO|nr:hypothetical protein DSL72_008010 [Monilinia vaccinii-corymbosi]